MNVLLLACRLGLALVFLVSGVSKLAQPRASRLAVQDFGVPGGLATPVAWALPPAELAAAVLLVPARTAWGGALVAGALLLVFSTAIAVNLRRGNTPDCHCFGQLHSAPISPRLLLRNAALAVPALVVILAGPDRVGLSASDWTADLRPVEAGLLAVAVVSSGALVVVSVLLWRFARRQSQLIASVTVIEGILDAEGAGLARATRAVDTPTAEEGLPIGVIAPAFELARTDGATVALAALLAPGRPVVLLFVSGTCGPCRELVGELPDLVRSAGGQLDLVAVTRGGRDDNERLLRADRTRQTLLLLGGDRVAEVYGARWTPAAVAVGGDGRIQSATVFGVDAVRSLIDATVQRAQGTAPAPAEGMVGAPVPTFDVARANGGRFTEADVPSGLSAIVFWRSTCPYCQEISDDLIAFEAQAGPEDPALVIAQWSDDPTTEQFTAPILLDADGALASGFGAHGTPSAVLIDDCGRIASAVVAGGAHVKALLGVPARPMPVPVADPVRIHR